jgi:hypothetical protein
MHYENQGEGTEKRVPNATRRANHSKWNHTPQLHTNTTLIFFWSSGMDMIGMLARSSS